MSENQQIISFEEIFNDDDHNNLKNQDKLRIDSRLTNILTLAIYGILFILGLAATIVVPIINNINKKSVTYAAMSNLIDTGNIHQLVIVDEKAYNEELVNFKEEQFFSFEIESLDSLNNTYLLITLSTNDDYHFFIQENKEGIINGSITNWPKELAKNGPTIIVVYESNKELNNHFTNLQRIHKNEKNNNFSNFTIASSQTNLKDSLVQFFCYILVIIPLVILNKKDLKLDYINFKKEQTPIVGNVATGFAYMFLTSAILGAITQILTSIFNTNPTSINQSSLEVMIKSSGAIFIFFTVVIFAPIVEELVFRKGIFGLIKKDKTAIIVSSLIFGLIHISTEIIMLLLMGMFTITALLNILILSIPYIGVGVFLGYWYTKNNRNITLLILLHSLSNLLSFATILLF